MGRPRSMPFQSTSPCGEQQRRSCPVFYFYAISIHIPVWGATRHGRDRPRPPCHFNPHPRVGNNLRASGLRGRRYISIHIPVCVWGGGGNGVRGPRGPPIAHYFNPHPHVGSNMIFPRQRLYHAYFNPHPRVGSNEDAAGVRAMGTHFNPHPRVGSNCRPWWDIDFRPDISIHIPVWGATRAGDFVH